MLINLPCAPSNNIYENICSQNFDKSCDFLFLSVFRVNNLPISAQVKGCPTSENISFKSPKNCLSGHILSISRQYRSIPISWCNYLGQWTQWGRELGTYGTSKSKIKQAHFKNLNAIDTCIIAPMRWKGSKLLPITFKIVNKRNANQYFAESVHLTAFCALSMSKNVHFCSGQRLPNFGEDQLQISKELPERAYFIYFQAI